MDLALAFIIGVVIRWRYASRLDAYHFAKSRRLLYQLHIPWNLLSLGFWAAAVALGSRYALDLDFPECIRYPGLTQCHTIKATWAVAIALMLVRTKPFSMFPITTCEYSAAFRHLTNSALLDQFMVRCFHTACS
jgi:hypothetical protein